MRILAIDKPRERSPLLTLFYKELFKSGHHLHLDVDNEDLTSAFGILGDNVTHIYWGFTPGTTLKNNAKLIKDKGIKIIYDPGDLSELMAGQRNIVDNLAPVGVDYIIARWIETEGYKPEFYKFVKETKWLNCPVIHIPWAVSVESDYPRSDDFNYSDPGWERRIDVAMMCTIADWDFHKDRRIAMESLAKLRGVNLVTGDWYGEEYVNILRGTKLFVVDPSRRDFPVQKYVEAPACGACIIGKIPTPLKGIFEHDTSCIEIEDYSQLNLVVEDYLKRPGDIEGIAQEGKKRVLENFPLDKSVELLYNGLK